MTIHQPDLHVVSLTYAVIAGNNTSFDNPPPVEFSTPEAIFKLGDGLLKVEMIEHYSQIKDASVVVEKVLRAWEVDSDFTLGRNTIRFIYTDAQVIDRTPRLPGSAYVETGGIIGMASVSVKAHVTRAQYPSPPPPSFRLNPTVETMLHRFNGYQDGKEPLQSMAYFCFTVLQALAGGKKEAATLYNIDYKVLDTLTRLSSTKGDPRIARKFEISSQPLTGAEHAWLEAAIKQIILRVGDTQQPHTLPKISFSDLPPLS